MFNPITIRIKILAILSMLILVSCSAQPSAAVSPTPATASTSLPTPFETPAPVSSAWVTFTDPTSTVQVQIPTGWQATSITGQMKGMDGLVTIDFAKADQSNLDAVCILRASDGTFGDQPEIQRTVIGSFDACIIATSLNRDIDNGSLLIIDLSPNRSSAQRFLQIYADPMHFQSIIDSLILLIPPLSAVTPLPMQTPSTPVTAAIAPDTYTADGITVEEYPVVSATVDTPLHIEFRQRIPEQVFARREKWRGYGTPLQLENANQRLTPFGISVNLIPGSTLLQIKHQDEILLDQVSDISAVSLSDSGKLFAFFASSSTGGRYLITADGAERMDETNMVYYAQPAFLGEALLTLRYLSQINVVQILQGNEVIYHTSVPQPGVSSPIHAFASYLGHWYLELDGLLIRDGVILNPQLGVSEIFGFTLLEGKPFYFYRQENQIGISYDGNEITPAAQGLTFQPYNDVIHDQCCEPAAFNASANQNLIWFFALRKEYWYYVELGIYP